MGSINTDYYAHGEIGACVDLASPSRGSICGSLYMQLVCRRALPLAGTPNGRSNCGIHRDPRPQVLHALIKQRQRDVERGRDAAERMARLAHDLKVSNHQRDKLAQKFTAKERELGALENRVRPLAFYSFTEKSSSRSVCAAFRKSLRPQRASMSP